MSQNGQFSVGEWLAQPELGRISRDGKNIALQPQVMELLVFLAHRAGEVVTAEELMENLWPGKVVTSSSIYVTVKQLRDALGDDPHRANYIKTIPKRGYRLIAKVDNTPRHENAARATKQAAKRTSTISRRTFLATVALLLTIGWLALGRNPGPSPVTAPPVGGPLTLAVLPFEGQDQTFGTGLQDHLTTRLAGIGSLRVIARGSVNAISESASTPAEVGRSLGADVLIGGQVQQSGGQWRIQVQLLEIATEALIWGTTFDRVIIPSEQFAVQSEISETIIAAVRRELVIDAGPKFAALPTANLEAYEQFLIGQRKLESRELPRMREAVQHLVRAVELDPAFAGAWASLGNAHQLLPWYGEENPEQLKTLAKSEIDRALELDSTLGEAHVALAHWIWNGERGDPARAKREFELSLQLSPNDAGAHQAYGNFLASNGHQEEAISQYRQALLYDPLSGVTRLNLAMGLERLGRPEEAYVEFQKLNAANPDFPHSQISLANIEITLNGRFVTALPHFYKAVEDQKSAVFYLALFYLQMENLGSAEQLLEWAESQDSTIDFIEYIRAKYNWMRLGAAAPRESFEALSPYLPDEPLMNEGRRFVAGILHLQRNHDLVNGRTETALHRYEEQFPSLVNAEDPYVDEDTVRAAVDLALIYQHLGEPDRARTLAQNALQATDGLERMGTYGYRLADVEALVIMGDTPRALERLEAALDRGYREAALYQMKHYPNLDTLHAEPKFKALLQKVETDISDQRQEIARLQSSGELMTLDTMLALIDGPSSR